MSSAGCVRKVCALGALAAVLGGLTACVNSPAGPTRFAPYSQTDLRLGTGPAVVSGDLITVHYTAWFYEDGQPEQKGAALETSRTGAPLQLSVGSSGVIFAWNQGLPGMQPGGLRRLVVPPSVGYGGFRTGPIPPWTTLVFEIELVSIDE
jgi:FKBP-type peptidyl-prolyl cis-trans isomerase FkpA